MPEKRGMSTLFGDPQAGLCLAGRYRGALCIAGFRNHRVRQQRECRNRHDRHHRQEPQLAGICALAERVDDPQDPGQCGEAVELAPPRRADPATSVVGEAEQGQDPAADDPGRGPERLVVADERDGDVGQRRMKVLVTEQRGAVHHDRHDRRKRQDLVGHDQIGAASLEQLRAHQQSERDRQARQDERGEAGGAARYPEQMGCRIGHDKQIGGRAVERRRAGVRASSERSATIARDGAAARLVTLGVSDLDRARRRRSTL